MLKDKLMSLKLGFSKKTEGNNKKNIENLVVFLILLIITIVAINLIWGSGDKDAKEESNNSSYKELAQAIDNNINSVFSKVVQCNRSKSSKGTLVNII